MFSSVVDDFITDFMTVEAFEEFRKREYNETDTLDCISGKVYFNRQSLHESLMCAGIHYGADHIEQFALDNKLDIDIEHYKKEVERCLKDLDETGGCSY